MTTRDDHWGPWRCEQCDGAGWIDVAPQQAHRPNLCNERNDRR